MGENLLLDALRRLVNAGEEERHRILEDLQVNLLNRNVELYNSIKDVHINHKKYRNELEWFKASLEGFFEFIEEKVLPRRGNATNRRNVIDTVLAMLKVCGDGLKMLVDAIYKDDKEALRGKTWSKVYGGLAAALFVVFVWIGDPKKIVLGGGSCIGSAVAYHYISRSDISEKIDQLETDVEELRRKVEKYSTKLMVVRMTDELSSP